MALRFLRSQHLRYIRRWILTQDKSRPLSQAKPGPELPDHLYLRDCERPIDPVRSESDLVALLDLFEHRRVLNSKYHGHRRHPEVYQRTMLEGDLTGALVDLANFAIAHRCRGCLVRMMGGVIVTGLSGKRCG